MLTGEAIAKMVDFSAGKLHDVDHLLHVFGLAKAIAEGEGLDAGTLHVIELTAVVHDIACPLCRKKYGSAPGKLQEKESAPLVREFFAGTDEPQETVARIAPHVRAGGRRGAPGYPGGGLAGEHVRGRARRQARAHGPGAVLWHEDRACAVCGHVCARGVATHGGARRYGGVRRARRRPGAPMREARVCLTYQP